MKDAFKKGFGMVLGIYCGIVFTYLISEVCKPKKNKEGLNNPVDGDIEEQYMTEKGDK